MPPVRTHRRPGRVRLRIGDDWVDLDRGLLAGSGTLGTTPSLLDTPVDAGLDPADTDGPLVAFLRGERVQTFRQRVEQRRNDSRGRLDMGATSEVEDVSPPPTAPPPLVDASTPPWRHGGSGRRWPRGVGVSSTVRAQGMRRCGWR